VSSSSRQLIASGKEAVACGTAKCSRSIDRAGIMDRKELVELAKRMGAESPSADSSAAEFQNFIHSATLVGRSPYLPNRRARARECIQRLRQILEESPHMPLTLADLAQHLNLERTYCCKVFQEITGAYFSEWVRKIRIARAQSLLRLPAYTITEVSHAVGYDDITTFSRNFRKELGVSPRIFRRLILEPVD
jgi:YesN/AraC family two-component response regulator